MAIREPGITHAISDTGPLISIFQSDSLDLVTALLPVVHIPSACVDELARHGWNKMLQSAGSRIAIHYLTEAEQEIARAIAQAIALHPISRDPLPDNHLGEAQAIALAARPEFADDVVLLDELAARAVAEEMGLTLSGFAGVLLVAVQMGKQKSIHEPEAQLLSGQDAIQDAGRLRALLRRNRERAEREVQLRVPLTVIIEALDQLEPGELHLLAQRLEERLTVVHQ